MGDDAGGHGEALRRLQLHDEHVRLGARMAAFSGWLMPLLYTSILGEHLQVRRSAGLFDVSHMGRFLVRGTGAVTGIDRLVASDVTGLSPGEARYTVLTTPWGGILDDLIVYRQEDGILLVVNAGRAAEDAEWLQDHLPRDATLDDLTDVTCLFALQGPEARKVLARLLPSAAPGPRPFTFVRERLGEVEATIMGTGYTGEEGVELLAGCDDAEALWHALLAQPEVAPCGLGARDTLRLEAALLLNTLDMNKSTTPFEARLGWLVELEDGDFVGRAALLEAKAQGPVRLLVGLATEARSIPRPGDVLLADGEEVGEVTSGSLSPVLGHPIALGYVRPDLAQDGSKLTARSRGREIPVQVVPRPFYRRGVTPVPPADGNEGGRP